MRQRSLVLPVLLAASAPAVAAAPVGRHQLESWIAAHQQRIVSELVDFVAIPNAPSDSEHARANATLLREMLARRGFHAELVETGGNPLVLGELKAPGATRSLRPWTPPRTRRTAGVSRSSWARSSARSSRTIRACRSAPPASTRPS